MGDDPNDDAVSYLAIQGGKHDRPTDEGEMQVDTADGGGTAASAAAATAASAGTSAGSGCIQAA